MIRKFPRAGRVLILIRRPREFRSRAEQVDPGAKKRRHVASDHLVEDVVAGGELAPRRHSALLSFGRTCLLIPDRLLTPEANVTSDYSANKTWPQEWESRLLRDRY
jgi:hypothetical protein